MDKSTDDSDVGFQGHNSAFYGYRSLACMGENLQPGLTFINPGDRVIVFRCPDI